MITVFRIDILIICVIFLSLGIVVGVLLSRWDLYNLRSEMKESLDKPGFIGPFTVMIKDRDDAIKALINYVEESGNILNNKAVKRFLK